MTSGDIHTPSQDLPQADFFERIVAQRERVIRSIQSAGGIDFGSLFAASAEAEGGRQHFKRISGISFGDIPLAFKQSAHNSWLLCDGFAEEIATLNHVAQQQPDLEDMLPRVHYELRRSYEEPVGILTEDFTRGGELVEWRETRLFGFRDMFTDPAVVDSDHEDHMVGEFGQREIEYSPETKSILRIIDVSPIYVPSSLPAWLVQEVGLDRVLSQIDDLRINIDDISRV